MLPPGTVAAVMGLFRRKPTVDPAQLAAVAAAVAGLRMQLDTLARRLDTGEADRRQLTEVVGGLQQRVASIGNELTNQLSELSGEIDALQARPDPSEAIAAVSGLRRDVGGLQSNVDGLASAVKGVEDDADGLRTGQERLAGEQARYQIAFREDLAALADQLARKRS
jgi:chromosome segregation ATPase